MQLLHSESESPSPDSRVHQLSPGSPQHQHRAGARPVGPQREPGAQSRAPELGARPSEASQTLQRERARHKEEQVEALKRSMQSGIAQAMKEQACLREEMTSQYRLGNFEAAAAAIQERLDRDVAM